MGIPNGVNGGFVNPGEQGIIPQPQQQVVEQKQEIQPKRVEVPESIVEAIGENGERNSLDAIVERQEELTQRQINITEVKQMLVFPEVSG